MSILQGYDGELRLMDRQSATTGYYFKVLFCNMDFTGPISRGKTEESLILDRGTYDSNSHYIEGSEEVIYGPVPISFTCRLADSVDTRILLDWVGGVTTVSNLIGGSSVLYTWSGHTTMSGAGVSVPSFDDSSKISYRVEVLWSGTTDFGYRYDNVFFKPGESTITESENAVTFNVSGQVFGDVSRINVFAGGTDYTFTQFV